MSIKDEEYNIEVACVAAGPRIRKYSPEGLERLRRRQHRR